MSPATKRRANRKPEKARKPALPKTAELLFEVGCEEIPAGMIPRAEADLRSGLEKQLTAENLMGGVTLESFSTPRRLTLWARGLPPDCHGSARGDCRREFVLHMRWEGH